MRSKAKGLQPKMSAKGKASHGSVLAKAQVTQPAVLATKKVLQSKSIAKARVLPPKLLTMAKGPRCLTCRKFCKPRYLPMSKEGFCSQGALLILLPKVFKSAWLLPIKLFAQAHKVKKTNMLVKV